MRGCRAYSRNRGPAPTTIHDPRALSGERSVKRQVAVGWVTVGSPRAARRRIAARHTFASEAVMPGGLAMVTLRFVLLGKSSRCSARRANLSARRQPQLSFLPSCKAISNTTSSVLHEQRTRHKNRALPLAVICTPAGPSTVRRRNCLPVRSLVSRPMGSPSSPAHGCASVNPSVRLQSRTL
jgi:hypothetical protein